MRRVPRLVRAAEAPHTNVHDPRRPRRRGPTGAIKTNRCHQAPMSARGTPYGDPKLATPSGPPHGLADSDPRRGSAYTRRHERTSRHGRRRSTRLSRHEQGGRQAGQPTRTAPVLDASRRLSKHSHAERGSDRAITLPSQRSTFSSAALGSQRHEAPPSRVIRTRLWPAAERRC
jgi:hypothetical protein